jgi:hypothetical protein
MTEGLEGHFGFVGDTADCLEHLRRQGEMGVDIHVVSLSRPARQDIAGVLRVLTGG